ncbi:MAG: tetratricopeptide repeat protein [Cyanobacteria bacterium J06606_4]
MSASHSSALINHRYRIIKPLAEGGFGKTFLVEDTQMPSRRHCVIKQLKPMTDRPEVFQVVQQRFGREAAVLESLGKGHRQIPDLYAYFEAGGQFYLVQEWMEGSPLSALSQQAWPEARVRSLLKSLLEVLTHVHSQNIIHRDIKPDNIIVRSADQLPCLIDFGAVKELMSTTVSASGAANSSLVIGTPGYMPPEQAAGRPTFSSDLYSLGMTMITLLTARSPAALPTNSLTGEALWQQFVPAVSHPLKTVLAQAVHPNAQTRYATAADMLAALFPNTLEQAVSADVETQLPPNSSTMPTVAVAKQGSALLANQSVSPATSQPTKGSAVGKHKLPVRGLAWVGAGASVLMMAAGLWSLRPRLSFEGSTAGASASDVQSTIQSLQTVVDTDPDNQAAKVELAVALREAGDYDQAIAQLDPVIAQSPDNVPALVAKGVSKMAVGRYTEAIDTFSQAIEQDANSVMAWIERGNAHYETGDYDSAIDDYRSALRIDPGNAQAYREWAAVNVVRGNRQEALQNLNLAIENLATDQDSTAISAYVNRGSRQAELGDRTKAVADWSKAASLPADSADEFASRGYAKSRLGNKSGAVDDYNQALIVNPQHVRSLVNRAYDFYEAGEQQQALNTLERALAVNPNAVTALILKGEIQAFGNPADWEGAIAAYSQALDVNPNDPDVLNNRCSAYFATEQLDLAFVDCDRGLSINPRSPSLYVGRGNIHLAQNNYEAAIRDFSRTIELGDEVGGDPRRQATAYSNRASALMQVQDIEGALADLNKALELKPDDAPDLYKRGLVKAALEDKAGARSDLRRAADIYIREGRTESHQTVLGMMEQLGL